jgi:hypothetical protein
VQAHHDSFSQRCRSADRAPVKISPKKTIDLTVHSQQPSPKKKTQEEITIERLQQQLEDQRREFDQLMFEKATEIDLLRFEQNRIQTDCKREIHKVEVSYRMQINENDKLKEEVRFLNSKLEVETNVQA